MRYRKDEKSGNMLSTLGFGCMRLPRNAAGIDMKKSSQLISKAVGEGVNYFDAAYLYPGTEEALGRILSESGLREKVFIATKLPISICRKAEDFDRFFEAQLKRLRTGYIDYYLMHNMNTAAQWQSLCALGIEDWLEKQKKSGRISRVGFSFHGVYGEFEKLIDMYGWDFCQIQYNYSNENYQAGVMGLRLAADREMPVIIMEPLLGGKLANGLPKQAEAVFKAANPGLTPATWGLRWLLNQPEVTVILSGMNSASQLIENLHTAENCAAGSLSEKEQGAYKKAVEIFKKSYKIPCTGCGYCLPCPHGVNIPGCFSAYNTSYSMGHITGMIQYATGTGATKKKNQTAGNCVGCKKCEGHCPQNIKISAELKRASKRLEPVVFKAAMAAMSRRAK